ncbi:MFS transporter [Acidianus sulfidivorans JP7]|uniref:MFS transporter n=1 Tax=Acidianus sulfidivorans JP7 TaxID=619593 RepID=A0A2U9IQI0_9CREN|nr:MFS transporter [Acidianus sulfidivorans]AWR98217.1 MFS transporter [Acidianus sulfidivorans JP7]
MNERPKINYVGSLFSWIMDSYDLGAVVITATILEKLFYPTLGLVGAVLPIVFTVITRPLGGFIFGYIADLRGRKFALVLTVLGYSLSIGLTSVIPTYYQIGISATIIISLLRLLQGVFIGGDVSSSFTTAMESVRKFRGLLGGLAQSGTLMGFVIVDLLFTYFSGLPNNFILNVGWRYIYAIGVIPALLAIFIRIKMTEPKIYVDSKRESLGKQSPIKGLSPIWQTIIVMIGFWIMIYAGPQFAPVFFGSVLHLKPVVYGQLALLMNLVGIPAMLISGFISDYLGRKYVGIGTSIIAVIGAFIFYFQGISILTATLIFGFLINFPSALTPAYLAERFKTLSRATGVGFSYNGAFIIAGFTQLMISGLSSFVKTNEAAFTILTIGAIISIIGLALGPETLKYSELPVSTK